MTVGVLETDDEKEKNSGNASLYQETRLCPRILTSHTKGTNRRLSISNGQCPPSLADLSRDPN